MTEPLFRAALGEDLDMLPPEVHQFHNATAPRIYAGEAEITRGRSRIAHAVADAFRFPKPGTCVPVRVEIQPTSNGERWTRIFNGRPMTSELTLGRPGHVLESFGAFRFELALVASSSGLSLPLRRGWILGLPVPRGLLPQSHAVEHGLNGRFHVDIRLSLPLIGPMVTYTGWLEPVGRSA